MKPIAILLMLIALVVCIHGIWKCHRLTIPRPAELEIGYACLTFAFIGLVYACSL